MSAIRVIVCCKQVPDPESPSGSYIVDSKLNKMNLSPGVSYVIDPYAERALEAALQMKDIHGGTITVLSLGINLSMDVIMKPLSMGADEVILIDDSIFDDSDSWSTAYALSLAIKRIGDYDLIFCGKQASDWNAGQVGLGIAEILGLPIITTIKKITIVDDKATVEKITDDGYQVIEVSLPVLLTVGNEIGEPRYPSIRGIMEAKKKKPTVWKSGDIGPELSSIGKKECHKRLIELYRTEHARECEMVVGKNPEELVTNLISKMNVAKIL